MLSRIDRKKFEALGLMPVYVNGKLVGMHPCVESLINLSNATKFKLIERNHVYALQDRGSVIPVAVDAGDRLEPITRVSNIWQFGYQQEFTSINLSNVYVVDNENDSLRDYDGLLEGWESLINVDASNLDTSGAKSMCDMFRDCANLVSLDLSNFDTSRATDMIHMFAGCKELRYLNLSNFDTRNISVAGIHGMFDGCDHLKRVVINKERNPRIVELLHSLGTVPSASAFWYRKIEIVEPT